MMPLCGVCLYLLVCKDLHAKWSCHPHKSVVCNVACNRVENVRLTAPPRSLNGSGVKDAQLKETFLSLFSSQQAGECTSIYIKSSIKISDLSVFLRESRQSVYNEEQLCVHSLKPIQRYMDRKKKKKKEIQSRISTHNQNNVLVLG